MAAGAAVDVAGVVGTVAAQLPSIAAVGVAVLGVIVSLRAFQWVRAALGSDDSDNNMDDRQGEFDAQADFDAVYAEHVSEGGELSREELHDRIYS
jgi:hypothetical protein